ncbi:extracellular solute-binding protein [Candidatus Falkowbacteria bacterium]|nr:extracellular solute-binding protein [Candidatus Falkowbacteria bacterium]
MLKQICSKILILGVAGAILFSVTACVKGGTAEAKKSYKSEKIVWWRVWDNEDAVSGLIKAYRDIHPNVTIEYRKFRYEEYEKALLEAMAEDRGPDIFSINNTWVERYKSKLAPLPVSTTIPIKYIAGSVKKEEVVELVTKNSLTPAQVKKNFLDVVAGDALSKDNVNETDPSKQAVKIWGLPLNVDTLLLFYNKDLLANAGIAEPPKNWTEFQDQVAKITKVDKETGDILVAGAGIGTANNVARSFDILSLLMMQNLAPMIENGAAGFDKKPKGVEGLDRPPGVGALEYYLQFASPLYSGYSWNDKMPNSYDAFAKGKVGFFFGYSYHRDQLRAQAPKLNFNIAPVPQVGEGQKVNYANYWIEVVSEKTKIPSYAWDFLQFITAEDRVALYLDKNKKTTALKSTKLINKQLADEELAVGAEQLLTAKSWYHGQSPTAAEEAFKEMINVILSGAMKINDALTQAVMKVNYSLNKKL